MAARMREMYKNTVFGALQEKFQYKNVMEIPKLEKITINMGLGEGKDNAKIIESAVKELALISGQQPVITKARKSIANFKVREGMPVGVKVTLRGDNMYEFASSHCTDFKDLRDDEDIVINREWILNKLTEEEN